MNLRHLFGLPAVSPAPVGDRAETSAEASAETATVRRIVGELESMPLERARYLAAFAYVLSRAAAADLVISDAETRLIEEIVMRYGELPEAQAVLVAEIAKTQARLYGGTEDFLVTRLFREISTVEQRVALLRCCFLVGAADDTISAEESSVLNQIGRELDLDREQVKAVRAEFADRLSAIQALQSAR